MGEKTIEERADKEVSKLLAKAIARRKIDIKKLEAKIKGLKKQIDRIKSGEFVPEECEELDSSSSSSDVKLKDFKFDWNEIHKIRPYINKQPGGWHPTPTRERPMRYDYWKTKC